MCERPIPPVSRIVSSLGIKIVCLSFFLFLGALFAGSVSADPGCVAGPHSGTLPASQEWCTIHNPHLVSGSVTVPSGVTLTIEAGVIVQFSSGTSLEVKSGGTLIIQGTSGQWVSFTSTAASPAPGNWKELCIQNGGHLQADYLDLAYAGQTNNVSLVVYSSNVQVRHSRIHHGQGYGIYIEGAGLTPSFEDVEIDHCSSTAIYQTTVNMRPSYTAMNLHDNGTDALAIVGSSLTQALTWDSASLGGAPVDVLNYDLIIDSGGALTVTAGTTARFASGKKVQIRNGAALYVTGAEGNPASFTSQAASPTPGSWWGIEMVVGARLEADYLDLAYAGQTNVSLVVRSSDTRVRHSRIHHGQGYGMYIEGTGLAPSFEDVEIDHCSSAAIFQTTPNMRPSYAAMNLHDNGTDALAILCASYLTQAVTWDSASLGGAPVDVLNYDLIIDSGGALTVTAGTTVRFASGKKVQIRNGAALYVTGAEGNPASFTSQAASPTPGSWRGIEVWQAGARFEADYLDLAYAGQTDNRSLFVVSSNVQVRHSRIHHGLGSGILIYTENSITPTLQYLEIDHVTGSAVVQNFKQSPIYEGIWAHDNGFDGLEIWDIGMPLTSHKTLDVSGFLGKPIVRVSGLLSVLGPDGSLEIPPGLTLEFTHQSMLWVEDGGILEARGTATQPITFTSAYADKQPGQWGGILTRADWDLSPSVHLEYCDIGYAGEDSAAALEIEKNSYVEISRCHIHHSSEAGIRIADVTTSDLYFTQNRITDNATNGLEVLNSSPFGIYLQANSFERNGNYGIYYDGGTSLEARYQYWGHPSGPYHPTANPTGLGDRVSDGVNFYPWATGETSLAVPPELVSPAQDEVLTTLPIRFRVTPKAEYTEGQSLYYAVEILQGGVQQYLFDQRTSTDGWDRASYLPGVTATLTLRDVLPNGAYTWRAAVFDGFIQTWSEERPFTVTLGVDFAVTGLSPEEVLGAPITGTFTVYGVGFVGGLAQVRVERRLWNDTLQTLTPINVQVASPNQITFGLNLTGTSGPWEVIVTQGESEARTPLFIYPYMPMFAYAYANSEILPVGRFQEHVLALTNFGSADGVAIVGLYGPKYAVLEVPSQAGVEYLGNPFSRMYLLAVQVNAGAKRQVSLLWKISGEVINWPGQEPDPEFYNDGAPLRYKFAVIGQLSTQAWNALKAEAPGDIEQQVYLATWGGALAEGLAADAYLDTANRPLAHDYIERLGAVYPFIADALVLRQYNDFTLVLYDSMDYPLPGPSSIGAQALTQNGFFKSWLERTVGDPWEFAKAFFTGFDDVISSGQAGAFLVAELEGLAEGMLFGLFRPSFGAKTMAHVSGMDPSAIGIGRFVGNLISIPIGSLFGQWCGKGVGTLLFKAHQAVKPTQDIYSAWNKLKFTITGAGTETERWGLSVISKNRDLPLVHWGNNPPRGGFHWAFGWEGKRVPGNLTGSIGEDLYGAGIHFYEHHVYVPDAFMPGVPFLHVVEDKALRQYANVVKESFFADIKLGAVDIGDHLFPPAAPPQDDSLCNQGAQRLGFSMDPNAIEGTPRTSHIFPTQEIGLMIHFENLITATLPAQDITVTLPIHPNVDWDSIRLEGASHDFSIHADAAKRTLTWHFSNINLPPNADPPEGEGWVRLSVYPSATLTTGQQITETAMIVFDVNPPLWTNVITYTIDLTPPSIELDFQEVAGPWVRTVITATDNLGGSGAAQAGLEYSTDNENWVQGPYITVITPTETITGTFHFGNLPGGHYWLRAFARDHLGNISPNTDPIEVDLPWGLRLPLLRSDEP